MKIFERAVYRWTDDGLVLVPEESVSFDYEGPLALCGGGNSGDQQQEAAQQQQSAQQDAYESQLMGLFSTQFSQQSGVLQYLQGQMQSNINNPQGYTPQQLASMRTSSDDTLSNQYQSAQQALNSQEDSQNSANIPSGVNDQLDASLLNSEAQAKSGAQNQITQANANLEQTNYWNSVNALNGVASEYNPDALASAANSAGETETGDANSVANLSNANTNASNTGLMGILGGVTSGIFGAAGKAGGFGSLFGCHVAAAVFCEPADLTGPNTALVREWLQKVATEYVLLRPLVWLYSTSSKFLASVPLIVRMLSPLFRWFLTKAKEVK